MPEKLLHNEMQTQPQSFYHTASTAKATVTMLKAVYLVYIPYLQHENIHGIEISGLDWNDQIHESKY